MEHIYSKIGLSKILFKSNILTPEFLVARNFFEATEIVKKIQYPVMIKVDSSSGGEGVFECCDANDLAKIPKHIFESEVLVQKKIIGVDFGLTAIYCDQKMVYFSCAKREKNTSKFGPSYLRTYYQEGIVDKKLFLTMERVGKALGLHGIVNITCVYCPKEKNGIL